MMQKYDKCQVLTALTTLTNGMIRWNKTVTYRDDIKIKNIAEGPFKYKRKNRGIFDVGKALTKKKLKQC